MGEGEVPLGDQVEIPGESQALNIGLRIASCERALEKFLLESCKFQRRFSGNSEHKGVPTDSMDILRQFGICSVSSTSLDTRKDDRNHRLSSPKLLRSCFHSMWKRSVSRNARKHSVVTL